VRESPIKKEPFYIERDEEKRREYDEKLAELPPELPLVYIDESGVREDMSPIYGRSPKGERVYLPCNGKKTKKINVVAGLCDKAVLCPTLYDWNTNTAWFNEWFEWYLCPVLPEKSVIIVDNASFHNKKMLLKIAESYGYAMIWLPPYSPDKNPIEKVWANMKNWLRLNAKEYSTIREAIIAYFKLN